MNKEELAIDIGCNVAEVRISCGFTQEVLAKKAKCHQVTIARIESGVKIPSTALLLKIAKACETELVPPTFKSISS